ncbi:MAG TPA: multidrug ABC transporter ATP-binding protein [Clostridiales bacterium UBA8153]|nr:multidrug ABC transporter ATP-binding protein [Clostridiales bacterium UBA8153]
MDIVKKLYRICRPHLLRLVLAVSAMFILTGLGMVRPYLAMLLIDRGIKGQEYALIPQLAVAVIIISAARGVFHFTQYFLVEGFGQRSVYDLRNALYRKLQTLSWSFYDDAQTGQLMARLTGDVEGIRVFLSAGVIRYCDFVFMVGFTLIVLFTINWSLTLVALVFLPFLAYAVFRFDRTIRPAYAAIQEEMAHLTSILQENVTGVRVVKAFAQEPEEIRKFAAQNQQVRNRRLFSADIWAAFFPYLGLLSNVSAVLVLWYGGTLVMRGDLTFGALVAFSSYIWTLIWPIRELGWMTNLLEQALAAGARVMEILERQPSIADAPDAVGLAGVRGHVEFRQVRFAFSRGEEVLQGIDLSAPPGKITGILGTTGSGKTSLVNLMGRFYDVSSGSVLIDGHDVRKVKLQDLRSSIGYVLQETFLFSASIRENIAYGRPGASMGEVEAAAKAAAAHDFIAELPYGYDTVVGERGVGLSGGQKQRVAMARAFLKDPRILVLDDATASVDMETERDIQDALRRLMLGRTTFIIAHRISSVMHADEIVLLERGRVVERGTHDRLLSTGSIYADIYRIQFRDREGMVREPAPAGGGDV